MRWSPGRWPTASPCAWPSCTCCWDRGPSLPELLLRGGRVVDATGSRDADVLVRDGVIVAVGPGIDSTAPTLDASGCVVAPGLVDLHTHLREPGREEAETVESGSRAAALGGYTTV